MAKDEIIARFEDVSFEYNANKPILKEVNFAIRRGLKITLMGQNGAGKSTLFGLLTGALQPEEGTVNIVRGVRVAISRQVIPRDQLDLTVREFFLKCFYKNYNYIKINYIFYIEKLFVYHSILTLNMDDV